MKSALAVAVPVLFLAACGGGTKDLCKSKNIVCDNPLLCDPDDGVCKCGGRGGVLCPSMFVCDSATNTCQSTRCSGVDCSPQAGTSCDVFDGTCKCGGTGGRTCVAGEVCNPASKTCAPQLNCNEVACPRNQACEQSTGKCLCGAASCAAGQFCSPGDPKTCVADVCTGVHCSGSNVCDKNDGYCKCNGVICQSGEACACPPGSPDAGVCADSARICRAGSACIGVMCGGGTTCDPVDGQCKCGGPGGPVCASNQICSLGPPPQCQGGAQCVNPDGGAKLCGGGTSCDSEDGKCKCGGRGGQVCQPADAGNPAEVCVSTSLQQSCRRPCDVRSPDCAAGNQCFFDSSAATPVAYCAAPTGMQPEDAACQNATACFSGTPARAMHCNGLALGQTGICRPYCDVAAGTAGCLQVPRAQSCQQINLAPGGYGYCLPI